jgi:septum formation protein
MAIDFVYLASASPRRRQLLAQIGVPFQILSVDVDESIAAGESPERYVLRVAEAKAVAGLASRAAARRPQGPVLGADTAVVAAGAILGKPVDCAGGVLSHLSRSEVTFREITREEARDYWNTKESRDKAGGYAIQGYGAVFVSALRGSYSGVMGLPLFETAQMLRSAGVPCWLETKGIAATDGH